MSWQPVGEPGAAGPSRRARAGMTPNSAPPRGEHHGQVEQQAGHAEHRDQQRRAAAGSRASSWTPDDGGDGGPRRTRASAARRRRAGRGTRRATVASRPRASAAVAGRAHPALPIRPATADATWRRPAAPALGQRPAAARPGRRAGPQHPPAGPRRPDRGVDAASTRPRARERPSQLSTSSSDRDPTTLARERVEASTRPDSAVVVPTTAISVPDALGAGAARRRPRRARGLRRRARVPRPGGRAGRPRRRLGPAAAGPASVISTQREAPAGPRCDADAGGGRDGPLEAGAGARRRGARRRGCRAAASPAPARAAPRGGP